METGGIKSSGGIRPQNPGTRARVNKVMPRAESVAPGAGQAPQISHRRVPEAQNLVSANGRVYDRAAPRGTYLNILV